MAKYKPVNYGQGQFIPVFFDKQILPGTFEYALNNLIDTRIDTSVFDERYANDDTGAPAYDPRVLLKIVLFAYSRGITTSRKIAKSCEENIIFMALSANTRPHFTTIADFISSIDREVIHLFKEVLLACDEMGLIGREMFAIDGCKLPSNASKEWSGTRADFKKKAAKMEQAIENMVTVHQSYDMEQREDVIAARNKKYIETLHKKLSKVRDWLDNNDDKPGKSGKPIKSNITDNDSAKMKTSKGVIQGYNGVTSVDSKYQVIVHAEAFGQASEHDLLQPMVDGTRSNFKPLGDENVFKEAQLTADSGFHTEDNMKMLTESEIDAYVADKLFRQRDPRFVGYERYKERNRKDRARREGRSKLFAPRDFSFADDLSFCLCPAGKRLYRSGGNVKIKGHLATKFKGPKSACVPCQLRTQCLRHPERTEIRQVAYFKGRSEKGKNTFTEKMKRKIDSTVGRALYSMRVAIVEPPFANICYAIGLDRFSLRGKKKVNTQWNLFCIIHNMSKIYRFGMQTG